MEPIARAEYREPYFHNKAYCKYVFCSVDVIDIINHIKQLVIQKASTRSTSSTESDDPIIINAAHETVLRAMLTFDDIRNAEQSLINQFGFNKGEYLGYLTPFYTLFDIKPGKKVRGKAAILGEYLVRIVENRKQNSKRSIMTKAIVRKLNDIIKSEDYRNSYSSTEIVEGAVTIFDIDAYLTYCQIFFYYSFVECETIKQFYTDHPREFNHIDLKKIIEELNKWRPLVSINTSQQRALES